MKKMYLFRILIALITLSMFYSCVNESTTDVNLNDSLITNEDIANTLSHPKSAIKIPSPIELYIFMEENAQTFNGEILNPVENLNKYYSRKSKALNFGVYASDLAYTTVFKEKQKTYYYFNNVKSLADELGLTDGFDEEMTRRVSANINSSDSLYNITSEAYWDACTYLEENDKKDILSYIVVGGWLESVYIAINSVKEFVPDDKLVVRVAEQQLLLENLVEHLTNQDRDEDLEAIYQDLLELQQIFDTLYDTDGTMTKEQFEEIAKGVKDLRSKLIS